MQTFLKLASNPKMFESESQFFILPVLFPTCEHKSHRKNDYDLAAICWVYRALSEVPDSRNGTAVPLVGQTRISIACIDLTVQ